MRQQLYIVCAPLCCVVLASVAAAADAPVSFRQQIRPIISGYCFKCHGPDPQTREAELRLDRFEHATADHDGHAAIVPGNAEASELVRRILSHDDAQRMPPPQATKQLNDDQRALLQRWIKEGAKYEPHWAFVSPKQPQFPAVSNPAWPRNDIDRFILAELDRNGLHPAAPADKYQLVRRLYLDLIGLPPTPKEADAFVYDNRPDAYEQLVDRLLASPHYGERWARRWLDLARYSDTNGYEKDRPRTMWLYRDWVIKAFNNDMPFTEFTIEQLAGDMLPGATQSQRIATGFHRNTMVNEEGGVDPQEFRFNSIVDRVGTTGTVWLGLTVGCAQCHTHKYDPITHQDYYRLFAFFNNANEIDEHVTTHDLAAKRDTLEKQISELVTQLPNQLPAPPISGDSKTADTPQAVRDQALQAAFKSWEHQTLAEISQWRAEAPTHAKANLATMAILADMSVLASGDVTKKDIYDLEFAGGGEPITAIRIEALLDDSLPAGGPGRQSIEVPNASSEGDFFLSELIGEVIEGDSTNEKVVSKLAFDTANATYTTPGLSPESAFDGRADTGWRVMGRVGEPHAAVFHLKVPVTLAAGQRLRFRLEHESFYPAGLGRFRFSFTSTTGAPAIALYPDGISHALRIPMAERSTDDAERLREFFLLHTPELKTAQDKIVELRQQVPKPLNGLVMQERSVEPRETRRHHRGEFLKTEEVVEPGVPEFLPPLPAGSKADRLTLARWLVDPQNPLVARVYVNRQWQAFFGRGLVRTLEDLGVQGEYPTHPELLDYLATEFIRNGWSTKKLHKLIVMSATYQQSDEVTPQLLESDPENKLLARAPRFRVEAELVRDITLKASGLLSSRVGGPSVFPDQPPGITEAAYGPLTWTVSTGEDRFRRGLYTFNKRTAPYASFALFDAPSGEACTARRTYSNTPLQALEMLNDSVTIVASRALATAAIQRSAPDSRAIAESIFRHCVTRPPQDREIAWLCRFKDAQSDRIRSKGGEAAQSIITNGDKSVGIPTNIEPAELAAWMLTARAMLNLDESLCRP